MKLLVSVRDVGEALAAAAAGADFIDAKEPRAGALGALEPAEIRAIVAALREAHPGRLVSATVGDFPPDAVAPVLARVGATAACGVDYVKVGVAKTAHALLEALIERAHRGVPIVPVFIADAGLSRPLIDRACAAPFPALMLDTQDKAAGSLFEALDAAAIEGFVRTAHAAGRQSGLAGALRAEHLQRLAALAPGFAGFRSAVCDDGRTGALRHDRVRDLRLAMMRAADLFALEAHR